LFAKNGPWELNYYYITPVTVAIAAKFSDESMTGQVQVQVQVQVQQALPPFVYSMTCKHPPLVQEAGALTQTPPTVSRLRTHTGILGTAG
jgi:hypothetical protein